MNTSKKVCALSFMPDLRLAYERILTEAKDILHILEKRYYTFTQQQFMFVVALDRCREIAFEPHRPISTIAQVAHYTKNVSDNRTDKRILKMFLVLVKDLNEFRRTLVKLTKQHDEKLEETMKKWKKVLEPTQDITTLRVSYPHGQLNHLSVDEKRNHFGGIISVMPLAMECARTALRRIEVTRVYRPDKSIKKRVKNEPTPRPKATRPCMLQAESSKRPGDYCKRAQLPISPVISSPVSSGIHTPVRAPIVPSQLSLAQIEDCKINRLLKDTENLANLEQNMGYRSGGKMNDSNVDALQYANETPRANKCLWKDKTCSEEFVDKMIEDKRKRDQKYLECKN